MSSKSRSLLALLLLVPAPSLGVLCAMVWWPESALGAAVFAFSKVWILLLPLGWHLLVDREKPSWSPPRKGGFGWGLSSGLAISVIILLAWFFIAPAILDLEAMRQQISGIGLDVPSRYLAGALYWVLINSVLEEYVWRWFVVSKSVDCLGRGMGIAASALFFTLHHVFALAVYMDWLPVLLCSTGVFVGGLVWSWIYARFESIWPAYLSHAIVDVCIFVIGAVILFAA
ncbi:MAG: CPBP family intramembrane glutamic endopeptidase [Puniceicoccaceae bacterium]